MSDDKVVTQLNERMGIDGAVRFDRGQGGLLRAVLTHAGGEAHVYAHGAHVTHWKAADHEPVLFVSERSAFEDGKAIRGGVPICFPWFAQKADDPDAPMHGIARTRPWKVRSVEQLGDGRPQITLVLKWSPHTLKLWPHRFVATQTVTLGDSLEMALWVKHLGDAGSDPLTFEAALHTYLAVGDVRKVRIVGLEGAEFVDKVDGLSRKRQGESELTVTGETDRVYLDTRSDVAVDDPGHRRRLIVSKRGSDATVVWNPWVEKSKRMGDFGDDEWPGMLCIETCNVGDHAVTLRPGEEHEMAAVWRVERLPS